MFYAIYNVCKNRTSAGQKFVFDRRNVQKRLAGLQDEYDILEPPEESQRPRQPPPTAGAGGAKASGGYRQFPASTTYKNVTLPLKSSKLASPFPEPVKMMPSHTVSDQEKADQMQADFRLPMVAKEGEAVNFSPLHGTILTMQEFDFDIEYGPRTQMIYIASLNCYPMTPNDTIMEIDMLHVNVTEDDWVLAA
ncbi:hypothetical protein NQ318_016113 [Aromia moschata]|uniref:Uncharacterized protein n=1 Tax=Aromia moschata TaxID=1265417 RepID=A0AAV8XE04_9CUCU|nr:hypothetical protein NQ318_016113 [Aromia moschata]